MLHTSSVTPLPVADSSDQDPRIAAIRFHAAVRLMESLLHDVRNPLNALSINAEVLMEKLKGETGVVPPSQEKNLKAIREQVQRVDAVLRQFALFVAPGPQRGEPNFSDVVTRAVDILGHESRRLRVKIVPEIAPEVRLAAADVSALGFLAMRPILRALERSEAGHEVRVRLTQDDHHAELVVQDDAGSDERAPEVAVALGQLARSFGGFLVVRGGELRLTLPLA